MFLYKSDENPFFVVKLRKLRSVEKDAKNSEDAKEIQQGSQNRKIKQPRSNLITQSTNHPGKGAPPNSDLLRNGYCPAAHITLLSIQRVYYGNYSLLHDNDHT